MKVTCQSCQAKYTIADEKVRGKVAKIRCKKCGTTIIVNGTDGALAASEPPPAASVTDYTDQGSKDEQWMVLVADGDQRTVTAAQVAALYAGGEINYETHAWKDGMAEWLPISQIDALRSVLDHGQHPTMTPFVDQASSEPHAPEPVAPALAPVMPVMPAPKPAERAGQAARIKAPEPAAARRPGRGGGADLFGASAHDEVMTSASTNPTPHNADDKPTGARNENSVLFSLSALTGGGGHEATAPKIADREPASKADLRSLMGLADNGAAAPAKSKLDDIMNLSGGGVYSPALMSPALAPPAVDFSAVAAEPAAAAAPQKKKGMLVAIGGGAVVIVGAVLAFALGGKSDATDKAATTASTTPAASAQANAIVAPVEPAPAPTPTPERTLAAAPAATPESAPTALAPGQAAPKPEKIAKVDKPDRPAAAAPAAEKPAAPAPPAAEKPAAPAAAVSGADFDRAAALSALSAAATAAQSCKKADGPTGSGRIAVTFANNGAATTAVVEGPPFSGTPVGGCVAARFRGVHVPAYGGATVTVRKTFMIN